MAKRKVSRSSKSNSETDASSSHSSPAKMSKLNKSKDDTDPSFDWQSTKETLTERFKFIYNTEQFADIHFIVGSKKETQQKIPAHKLVLSVGSAVFNAMFSGNWAPEEEIKIPDIEPDAFLCLLQFLYTDNADLSDETVIAVLYAAKKYAINALENYCLRFFEEYLDASNVFTILEQAKLFKEFELVEKCLKIIDNFPEDTIEGDKFTDIDLNTLSSILERDTLKITERRLLVATIRWSKAECARKSLPINSKNQAAVLKDSLYLIRFPTMSEADFSSLVAKSELLPDKDIVSMFVHFNERGTPPINFNATPRLGPCFVFNRFRGHSHRTSMLSSGKKNTFNFLTSDQMQLEGIGLYTSCLSLGCHYDVEFSIQGTDEVTREAIPNNIIVSTSWKTLLAKSSLGCEKIKKRLFLDNPVRLMPDLWYTFNYSIKGEASTIYGKNGKDLVKVPIKEGSDIFITGHFRAADEKSNKNVIQTGQLPELLFTLY